MITRTDIDVPIEGDDEQADEQIEDPPWADVEPKFGEDLLDELAEDFAADSDAMYEQLKRDQWLADRGVETTLLVSCEHVIGIDHDTRNDHNVHVYTDFEVTPSDIALADGLAGLIGWTGLSHTISSDTAYRVTNKRLVTLDRTIDDPDRGTIEAGTDVLVLTLAPDPDTDPQSDTDDDPVVVPDLTQTD